MTVWRTLRHLARDNSGNFATLFALTAPILIGVAAFAVDEASLFLERRQLQATADLAAIHAAGNPAEASDRVRQVLADAGYDLPDNAIRVVTGHYAPDPALPPPARFSPDTLPANAVRVALTDTGRLHFASIFGLDAPRLGVQATASATPRAAYSIGSRLANLNGGIANAVLGGLLGTELNLKLMDYQALVDLDVGLLEFLDALAGEIDVTAGTYSDLLNADIALVDIAAAIAVAAGGNAVLLDLAGLADEAIMVDMARLVAADGLANLGIGTSATLDARINALQMLTMAAVLGDGNRQITLGLGADVPGLVRIGVSLAVGEPPQGAWLTFAGPGSYVRTAQTRLKLDIALMGHGGIGLVSIQLPVYAELAPSEAQLVALSCPPGHPTQARATIAARPGVLRLAVGDIPGHRFFDTSTPLPAIHATPIVDLLGGLARVSARADVALDQTSPHMVMFTGADIAARTVRTVSTRTPVSSLTASLLGSLELDLEILRFNLLGGLLSGVLGTIEGLIAPIAPVLDQTLVALFDVLGLGIGEADLRLHGIDCRNAALVQ